jgi:hypothetical protein
MQEASLQLQTKENHFAAEILRCIDGRSPRNEERRPKNKV